MFIMKIKWAKIIVNLMYAKLFGSCSQISTNAKQKIVDENDKLMRGPEVLLSKHGNHINQQVEIALEPTLRNIK